MDMPHQINNDKTKLIYYNNIPQGATTWSNDTLPLDPVSSITVLVITIDDNLNWSVHISNLCKNCVKFVVFKQLRRGL